MFYLEKQNQEFKETLIKTGLIELAESVLFFMMTTLTDGGQYEVDKKYEAQIPYLPEAT